MITLTIIGLILYALIPQWVILNLNRKYGWTDEVNLLGIGVWITQSVGIIAFLEYFQYI